MIRADRREGGIKPDTDERARIPAFWRALDRRITLGIKIIIPVTVITLLGTGGLGLVEAQQTNAEVEATYETSASAAAGAAATAFYNTISYPEGVDQYLSDLVRTVPNAEAIYIVNVGLPGQPVVAASNPAVIGRTGVIDSGDVETIVAGRTNHERHVVNGNPILETVVPVSGNAYGVTVITSLSGEDSIFRNKIAWAMIAAILICALEVTAMAVLLNAGILRRVRRVGRAVESFGRPGAPVRLSEGMEPPGRDALFNLARSIDHKLEELTEHERAGFVISRMGALSLQGTSPAELTRKALELVRDAAGLERCFLAMAGDRTAVVDSYGEPGSRTSKGQLPIWVVSLCRAARLARKPVLADSLGEGCRYWVPEDMGRDGAQAAFVPVPGTPEPIATIVGIAREGSQVAEGDLALLEAVATALGESLQRSEADRARHESEAKSKALHTVSHEIRNPLNAMLGFNDLLLSGAAGPLNEKQLNYLRKVDDASHHLLRLVNDYLDLAKVMSGTLPVQSESIIVGPEVVSVLDLMRPTADAKHVNLHAEVPPAVVARADRLRLRQVLMNLVSNAVKFTPANGHVRVEVAGGSNGVRISVIDTGIGIPAERQHVVFTEFAQLAPNAAEGTGLGLALTKRLVEAMGGFIRFTSAEGAGTIFDVWLPGEQSPITGDARNIAAVQGVA